MHCEIAIVFPGNVAVSLAEPEPGTPVASAVASKVVLELVNQPVRPPLKLGFATMFAPSSGSEVRIKANGMHRCNFIARASEAYSCERRESLRLAFRAAQRGGDRVDRIGTIDDPQMHARPLPHRRRIGGGHQK